MCAIQSRAVRNREPIARSETFRFGPRNRPKALLVALPRATGLCHMIQKLREFPLCNLLFETNSEVSECFDLVSNPLGLQHLAMARC